MIPSAAYHPIQTLSCIEKILILFQNVPATNTYVAYLDEISLPELTLHTNQSQPEVSNVHIKQTQFLISAFYFIVPF